MKKNQQVLENNKVIKQFNYSKGDTNLNFSLRIDIKNDLRDFKELLEAALGEVANELTKFK